MWGETLKLRLCKILLFIKLSPPSVNIHGWTHYYSHGCKTVTFLTPAFRSQQLLFLSSISISWEILFLHCSFLHLLVGIFLQGRALPLTEDGIYFLPWVTDPFLWFIGNVHLVPHLTRGSPFQMVPGSFQALSYFLDNKMSQAHGSSPFPALGSDIPQRSSHSSNSGEQCLKINCCIQKEPAAFLWHSCPKCIYPQLIKNKHQANQNQGLFHQNRSLCPSAMALPRKAERLR